MADATTSKAGRSKASGPAPDEAPVFDYPVLSPLRHDGILYLPARDGETPTTVSMTEAQADTLQAIGVLGKPAEA